jgi:hypothetical protein
MSIEHYTYGSNEDHPGSASSATVLEKETRQTAYRLHCSNHFKKSDWGQSAIFMVAAENFPVLLTLSNSMLPLKVFDRKYLVEYPSRKI